MDLSALPTPEVQDHREVLRRPGRGPRPGPTLDHVRDDPTHAEATYVLPGVRIRLHEARYELTLRREDSRPHDGSPPECRSARRQSPSRLPSLRLWGAKMERVSEAL